jgi:hypothetical protein
MMPRWRDKWDVKSFSMANASFSTAKKIFRTSNENFRTANFCLRGSNEIFSGLKERNGCFPCNLVMTNEVTNGRYHTMYLIFALFNIAWLSQ